MPIEWFKTMPVLFNQLELIQHIVIKIIGTIKDKIMQLGSFILMICK